MLRRWNDLPEFMRVPEVKQQNAAQTMIINYGDGNSREGFWDNRAVEVTIQILNGETNELICVCRADDKGSDEAKAISRDITKCLDEIFLEVLIPLLVTDNHHSTPPLIVYGEPHAQRYAIAKCMVEVK